MRPGVILPYFAYAIAEVAQSQDPEVSSRNLSPLQFSANFPFSFSHHPLFLPLKLHSKQKCQPYVKPSLDQYENYECLVANKVQVQKEFGKSSLFLLE